MKLIKQLPLLTALVAISFTAKAQQPDSLDVMLQGASAEEMASLVIHEGGTVTHQLPVRRQPTWDQWARFLRDTFLPVASPV